MHRRLRAQPQSSAAWESASPDVRGEVILAASVGPQRGRINAGRSCFRSLHLLDVVQFPCLFEERLFRAIKAEEQGRSRIAGHSSILISQRYVHPDSREARSRIHQVAGLQRRQGKGTRGAAGARASHRKRAIGIRFRSNKAKGVSPSTPFSFCLGVATNFATVVFQAKQESR